MKPSEYIRKGWTKRAYAIDERGHATDALDPEACKWCLLGALDVSQCTLEDCNKVFKVLKERGFACAGMWNDDPVRTQQEVIELLESCGL